MIGLILIIITLIGFYIIYQLKLQSLKYKNKQDKEKLEKFIIHNKESEIKQHSHFLYLFTEHCNACNRFNSLLCQILEHNKNIPLIIKNCSTQNCIECTQNIQFPCLKFIDKQKNQEIKYQGNFKIKEIEHFLKKKFL